MVAECPIPEAGNFAPDVEQTVGSFRPRAQEGTSFRVG
jgi:hypothetical protein